MSAADDAQQAAPRRNRVLIGPSRQPTSRTLTQLNDRLDAAQAAPGTVVINTTETVPGGSTSPVIPAGLLLGTVTSVNPLVVAGHPGTNATGFPLLNGNSVAYAFARGSSTDIIVVGLRR